MTRRVYVVEVREHGQDEWHPHSAHVDKRDALRWCESRRPIEGGRWRVTAYVPEVRS